MGDPAHTAAAAATAPTAADETCQKVKKLQGLGPRANNSNHH